MNKKEKMIPALKAAEMMGLSQQRIYRYLSAGRFPGAKKLHGTRWHLMQSDIDAFLTGEIDLSGVYSEKEE